MWKATRITKDAADKIQTNAGLLLNEFDVTNAVEPSETDIICDTTGDFTITATPTTEDFFADINNAPVNTKEGLRITGWDCSFSVTAVSITDEVIKTALGAAEVLEDGGIAPRDQYVSEDFKKIYWIGDMIDTNKLFVIAMDNTVSVDGISFTSTKNGKGTIGITLKPLISIANPTVMPMAFYILEKVNTSVGG